MSVWSPSRAFASLLIRQQERRLQRFLNQTRQTAALQQEVLFSKIRKCASSQFGQEHGFSAIRNIDDFRRQLPIVEYDYYSPYIQRVARGEVGAMFPEGEQIIMFTLTSGTTGEPKLIPVTKTWLNEFKASWNLWGLKVFVDHPSGILRKIVSIVGNWDMRRTESNIPCGLASGLSTRHQHPFVRRYYSIPPSVFSIKDATSRYYTMLRLTLPEDVGLFVTSTPATVIRFAQLGDQFREQLIRDIANGSLSQDIDISADMRRRLRKRISVANPRRAAELERIVQRTGHLYPKDYWNLSQVACWLGGTVAGNVHQIPDYFGDTARRDIGLISSEGRHTVPLDDNRPEGVLAFNHHYYEFIPAGEIHSQHPTILECHELEVGQKYFILMTTSSGLYRYNINDLVQCNGYVGQAPIIEFLHKGDRIADMEGEKISERHIVNAVTD
ncbi:MAG: GH3 auxin-responsive promoter family protein, partial [Planctomycetota bacterium]|nr:GH3 auxin-responsive promoter family protein [Planctomycetota bacterium]